MVAGGDEAVDLWAGEVLGKGLAREVTRIWVGVMIGKKRGGREVNAYLAF